MNTARKSGGTELPDGWRIVGLGEVAEVAFSNVDKRTVPEERAVLLCNYTDVFYNRRITAGMNFMAATATSVERDRWELKKGDVLFTKDSETADEIGIPSVVTEDMPGILCGYHLGLARPSGDLVDGAFLAAALNSATCRRHFTRVANGVTRFGLTLEAARSLPVFLPPLPEQRAIADVLDSIDGAIERTEAVIAATETLRDSLLHELLTRGVPGWHTEWKDVPGIGTIPANWEVGRLGEVIMDGPTNGIYKPELDYGDGSPIIRIDDFISGELVNHDRLRRVRVEPQELQRYAVGEGEILINRVNSLSHIGKTVLVPAVDEATLFESNMMKLKLNDRVHPKFGEIVLLSSFARRHFVARAKKAVQQASINQQDVAALPFPLPSMPEQQTIVDFVQSVDRRIDASRIINVSLVQAKSTVADALLTGRIRLEVD